MQSKWIPIGLSAGLAASLYLVVTLGSFGAMVLSYLAPLPLFAAGLGLGLVACVVATGLATVLVGFSAGPISAAIFFVVSGLPTILIVQRALLSRPLGDDPNEERLEWYPPGLLISWLCGLAAAAMFAVWAIAEMFYGGLFAIVREFLQQSFEHMLKLMNSGGGTPILSDAEKSEVLESMASVMPATALVSWTVMIAVNGILAQGLLSRFSKNIRPSPKMVDIRLPKQWVFALAAAVLIAGLAPAPFDYLGGSLMPVLALPFLFSGLGVVHAMAGRATSPVLWKVLLYAMMIIFGWPALIILALGFFDHWFDLKRRFPPPDQTSGSNPDAE